MYRRILVPTDGGEASSAAIEQAVGLASTFDAEIHGLYVVNTGAVPTTDVEAREDIFEELNRRGTDALADLESAAAEAGVDVVTSIVSGVPYDRILEYVDDEGVDLIVMGTHGRTGLRKTLLGSVAERVIEHATVPVLVNRRDD